MASAFRDSKGWIADFKGPFGGRRRVRVPPAVIGAAASDSLAASLAKGYALECESLAECMSGAPTAAQLARARELRVISAEEFADLTACRSPGPAPVTLEGAALMHPACIRERRVDPALFDAHLRYLREFCEWSGVSLLVDLRLDIVLRWVDVLRSRHPSWWARKHRLVYLRRASRMGATLGIPDVIGGMSIDRDSGPLARPDAWTVGEIAKAAQTLSGCGDARPLAVLGLGALMGLRGSEIFRLRVRDFCDDVVSVGVEVAKTRSSRRDLVVPPLVLAWIRPLLSGRDRAAFLLETRFRGGAQSFDRSSFPKKFGPIISAAAGRSLPAKCLRKTFATWTAREGLPIMWVEHYLGHESAALSRVTVRHYLAAASVEQMRPFALEVDSRFSRIYTANLHQGSEH